MKHTWNEALAAYDRELPMLHALREEYLDYVRERMNGCRDLLSADLAERATFETATDDDPDAGAEIVLLGERRETGIQCQLGPSADRGGEPGTIDWVVLLPTSLPKWFGHSRRYVDTARRAWAGTGQPLEGAPPHLDVYPAFTRLGWGYLRLEDPDLAATAATTFREVVGSMVRAADAVLTLRDT